MFLVSWYNSSYDLFFILIASKEMFYFATYSTKGFLYQNLRKFTLVFLKHHKILQMLA